MVQPKSFALQDSNRGWLPQFFVSSSSKTSDKYHKNFTLYKSLKLNYYHHASSYKKLVVVFAFVIVACLVSTLLASHLNDHFNTNLSPQAYPWRSMSRPVPTTSTTHSRYRSRMKNYGRTSTDEAASVTTTPEPKARYDIPDTMAQVGDKTDFYSALRLAYDSLHPSNPKRSMKAVEEQRLYSFEAFRSPTPGADGDNDESIVDNEDVLPFDVYNCPSVPPLGYPYSWNILDILHHWPADDPEPRLELFQGICVFDYVKDHDKALAYRNAEVPFVVTGDPAVAKVVERWNTPHYMEALLGDVEYEAEYSVNNHFLFWDTSIAKSLQYHQATSVAADQVIPWQQPTQMIRMKYTDWFDHANVTDDKLGPNDPHWYFKLMGCGAGPPCAAVLSEFLFDELPFFQPAPQSTLYLKEPEMQRGVLCRFGMKGVIAENHFDGGRNVITVLKGERRYILSHPNQCENLALYPEDHPSARHSAVDWSDPDLDKYPQFAKARGNEVVLQAGDTL